MWRYHLSLTRRAATTVVAVVALTFVGAVGRAPAQTVPVSLQFIDPSTLTLKWTQLAKPGVPVKVCNVGERNLVPVFELAGFNFTRSSKAIPVDKVLRVQKPPLHKREPTTLGGGSCETVTLLPVASTVDPGTYSGQLVVYAAGGGMIHRDIAITGPGTAPIPTGAATTTVIQAYRTPLVLRVRVDDPFLPIAVTNQGRPTIPPPGTFLGHIFNKTSLARVYVADAPRWRSHDVLVPLRIEGATKPGDYTGTLDVAQNGKPADAVKVDVSVTDAWWWATLAVLIGAGIPLVMTLYWRRWRVERRLRDRARMLAGAYYGVQLGPKRIWETDWWKPRLRTWRWKLQRSWPALSATRANRVLWDVPEDEKKRSTGHWPFHWGFKYSARLKTMKTRPRGESYFQGEDTVLWRSGDPDNDLRVAFGRPSLSTIWRYEQLVERAISQYARTTWYFDTTSPAYAQIEKSLKLVADDGEVIQTGAFSNAMNDLEKASKEWREWVKTWFPGGRPRLGDVVKSVLTPGGPPKPPHGREVPDFEERRLRIGEATARTAHATALVKRLKDWQELATELLELNAWVEELQDFKPRVDEKEWGEMNQAAGELGQACDELFRADTEAAMDHLCIADTLKRAYGRLGPIAGREGRNIRMPSLRDAKPYPVAPRVEAIGADAETPAIRQAKPVEFLRARRWVSDVMVLILAIAIGVITGLSAFYFGKTFGTVEDYLTIIFVGAASMTLVNQISNSLVSLREDAGGPRISSVFQTAELLPLGPTLAADLVPGAGPDHHEQLNGQPGARPQALAPGP